MGEGLLRARTIQINFSLRLLYFRTFRIVVVTPGDTVASNRIVIRALTKLYAYV